MIIRIYLWFGSLKAPFGFDDVPGQPSLQRKSKKSVFYIGNTYVLHSKCLLKQIVLRGNLKKIKIQLRQNKLSYKRDVD